MKKLIALFFIIAMNNNIYGQEISYSDLNISSTNLKNSLQNSGDFFINEPHESPYFQGKSDSKYIKFYNSTGVVATMDFKSQSEYLKLINQIQGKANFRFKFCTDYEENIVYNYQTSNGNKIRFNFNEMRISVEYPSSTNTFIDSNFEFTSVFVCSSNDAYAYHTNLRCEGLGNCDSQIEKTDIKQAKKNGYKFCEICTSDKKAKEIINTSLTTIKIQKADTNYELDLSFVRKYEGDYMFGEICDTEPLKSELKILLGDESFEKYIEYIGVQSPIKIEQNQTLLVACLAHSCGIYESALFLDLELNLFYIGLLDNKNVYTYSNNAKFNRKNADTYPSEFLKWTSNAIENAE